MATQRLSEINRDDGRERQSAQRQNSFRCNDQKNGVQQTFAKIYIAFRVIRTWVTPFQSSLKCACSTMLTGTRCLAPSPRISCPSRSAPTCRTDKVHSDGAFVCNLPQVRHAKQGIARRIVMFLILTLGRRQAAPAQKNVRDSSVISGAVVTQSPCDACGWDGCCPSRSSTHAFSFSGTFQSTTERRHLRHLTGDTAKPCQPPPSGDLTCFFFFPTLEIDNKLN